MKCPKCGADLIEGARICRRCGTSLVSEKPCVYCQHPMPSNAMVCPNCGKVQPIPREDEAHQGLFHRTNAPAFVPHNKDANRWWLIPVVVLSAFVIFFLGFAVGHDRHPQHGMPSALYENSHTTVFHTKTPIPTEEPIQTPKPKRALEESDIPLLFQSPEEYRNDSIEFTQVVLAEPVEQSQNTLIRTAAYAAHDDWQFNVVYTKKDLGVVLGDTVKVTGKIISSSIDQDTSVYIVTVLASSIEIISHTSETASTTEGGPESEVETPPTAETNGIWGTRFTPITDFRYKLDRFNNTITLLKYTGNDTKILLSPVYMINGQDYWLTAIGDDACFLGETDITSVYIPEGVTEIGATTFNSCSQLEYLYLPSTLQYLPDNFFSYLHDFRTSYNNVIELPGERDMMDYPESTDTDSEAYKLGESFAGALNGLIGGLAGYDVITHIYYGGSEEMWNVLRG